MTVLLAGCHHPPSASVLARVWPGVSSLDTSPGVSRRLVAALSSVSSWPGRHPQTHRAGTLLVLQKRGVKSGTDDFVDHFYQHVSHHVLLSVCVCGLMLMSWAGCSVRCIRQVRAASVRGAVRGRLELLQEAGACTLFGGIKPVHRPASAVCPSSVSSLGKTDGGKTCERRK